MISTEVSAEYRHQGSMSQLNPRVISTIGYYGMGTIDGRFASTAYERWVKSEMSVELERRCVCINDVVR